MKKMIRKSAVIGCCILMLTASLTACSKKSSTNTNDNTTKTESNADTEDSSAVYGKVTAIDGKNVTLALGEMSKGGGMGEAPSGNPPQAPNGNSADGSSSGKSATDSSTTQAASKTASNGSADNTQSANNSNSSDTNTSANNNSNTTTSDGNASGQNKPSGNAPDGNAPGGNNSNGQPPQGMGGSFTENGKTLTITIDDESLIKVQSGKDTTDGSLDDIEVDSILCIKYADDNSISSITVQQSGMGMPGTGGSTGGSDTSQTALSGAYTVDGKEETSSNKTIETTQADQSAVLVQNGGSLTISGATLNKTGDSSSTDSSNFTGLNGILVASGKGTVTISDSTLTSDAEGANAIFSTGEGSTVNVSNVKINTSGNSSRGLDATYDGTITAENVDITTKGAHCACLATDRGEGTVSLTGGTLSAAGDGSPCIYSTGTITAANVTGTATGSQAAVIEGKNSITLKNCDLTGAGKNGIMIYQSTSGDAAVGSGTLTSTDSKITSTSTGEMFYITNTDAVINLTNTTLKFSSGILLNAAGNNTNNWGTPGSNGGNVTLTGSKQVLEGDITCDDISTVKLNLTNTTAYTGKIDNQNTGDVTITLDAGSKWNVTGDSYITAITDAATDLSNIVSNGHTVYYDSTNSANSWLNGKTITLSDGGSLTPMK